MAITLRNEARGISRLEGEETPCRHNLYDARREAEAQVGENGLVVPMWLLTEGFPHSKWYNANSEDISGIARSDSPFGKKGDDFVVTFHGGRDGKRMLPPDVIEKVVGMWRKDSKTSLTTVYAANLEDAYGKRVFTDFLNGGLPDGSPVDLFSFEQVKAGEHYGHMREYRSFGIVRSLALARETHSGYQSIDNLAQLDESGKIVGARDSQVIAHTGGVKEGGKFLASARKNFSSGKVGVWHWFNREGFHPEQEQARVLSLGEGFDGLDGDYVGYDGQFVGLPQEAFGNARKKGDLAGRVDTREETVVGIGREHKLYEGRGKVFREANSALREAAGVDGVTIRNGQIMYQCVIHGETVVEGERRYPYRDALSSLLEIVSVPKRELDMSLLEVITTGPHT